MIRGFSNEMNNLITFSTAIDVIRQTCTQTLKTAQPGYQGNPSDDCLNNIQAESMIFNTQECGVTFSNNNWEMPVNLIVTGYVDNVYNSDDRTSHIRLKIKANSSTGLSGVWDTVNIPDIQVSLYRFFFYIQTASNLHRIGTASSKLKVTQLAIALRNG